MRKGLRLQVLRRVEIGGSLSQRDREEAEEEGASGGDRSEVLVTALVT